MRKATMPLTRGEVDETNATNASGSTIGALRMVRVWPKGPARCVLRLVLQLREPHMKERIETG